MSSMSVNYSRNNDLEWVWPSSLEDLRFAISNWHSWSERTNTSSFETNKSSRIIIMTYSELWGSAQQHLNKNLSCVRISQQLHDIILTNKEHRPISASWWATFNDAKETSRTDLGDSGNLFFFRFRRNINLCTILEKRARDQEGSSNG